MYTRIESLTPARAQAFLNNMIFNRDINRAAVANFVEIIKTGRWKVTHQGLAVDVCGRFIDGQHCCIAVIETGITVQVLIAYDCDPAIFDSLDQGTLRTLPGILSTLGYDGTKRLGAIARQAMLYQSGKAGSNKTVISSAAAEFVKQNREALDYTNKVTASVRFIQQSLALCISYFQRCLCQMQ